MAFSGGVPRFRTDLTWTKLSLGREVEFLMTYEDKTLECKECGAEFIFTAGEQEFYAEKGFTNEPARCRECRQQRKQRGRTMTEVVCANCGAATQVPFTPSQDRPVYCKACYDAMKVG